MTGAPVTGIPYAEYLANEQVSDTKHEYVNGLVYAMAGGSPEHGRLAVAASTQLLTLLRGRCRVFSSDVRILVRATQRSAYPDVSVVCGTLEHASEDPAAITNPTLLVEVLSPSTEASDRGEKWAHYQRLPSLRAYVLISQTDSRVEVFRRANESWIYEVATAGRLRLDEHAELDVDELYRDRLA